MLKDERTVEERKGNSRDGAYDRRESKDCLVKGKQQS